MKIFLPSLRGKEILTNIQLFEFLLTDVAWWTSNTISGKRFLLPNLCLVFSLMPAIWAGQVSGMGIKRCQMVRGWQVSDGPWMTGVRWSVVESNHHVDWLELQACFLSPQCFCKDWQNTWIRTYSQGFHTTMLIVKSIAYCLIENSDCFQAPSTWDIERKHLFPISQGNANSGLLLIMS